MLYSRDAFSNFIVLMPGSGQLADAVDVRRMFYVLYHDHRYCFIQVFVKLSCSSPNSPRGKKKKKKEKEEEQEQK